MLRGENGITLVALIITIIILVILAAVSITAAYNSGIIDYSVNGTQNYVEAAKSENSLVKDWGDKLDSAVKRIESSHTANNPQS